MRIERAHKAVNPVEQLAELGIVLGQDGVLALGVADILAPAFMLFGNHGAGDFGIVEIDANRNHKVTDGEQG